MGAELVLYTNLSSVGVLNNKRLANTYQPSTLSYCKDILNAQLDINDLYVLEQIMVDMPIVQF